MKKISKDFQGILWSKKINSLDLKEDKNYIIHQVLAYGDLKQIKWLFKTYSKKEIVDVFVNLPKKTYTPSAFNFVKNYILDLGGRKLDAKNYVKAIS